MKILIIHGPNLQLLGEREPEVYGSETLADLEKAIRAKAEGLGVAPAFFQSNSEGELVSRIGACISGVDGIIINPAAYTHTSIALRDAISAVKIPCVEVHLSNTASREAFRHQSYTLGVCMGQVMGFGAYGYILALEGIVNEINRRAAHGA